MGSYSWEVASETQEVLLLSRNLSGVDSRGQRGYTTTLYSTLGIQGSEAGTLDLQCCP